MRALNWRVGLGITLDRLARTACHRADFACATALLGESLQIRRAEGTLRWLAEGLVSAAMLAADAGQALRAARLFGAAEDLERQVPNQVLAIYREDRARAWA